MKDIRLEKVTLISKQIVHWLLVATIVLFLITGFGITEFRITETLTFGLLTKALAFKIHNILWIPFLILLILHIYLKTRDNR